MKDTMEKRIVQNPELRISGDGDDPKISGYAAVFNADSEDMGFIERIKPGAFKGALKSSDVRALINHDPNLIVGRTGVNLKLTEDKTGLHMELTPPSTDSLRYNQLMSDIRSGLINQQSFGFTIEKDSWKDLDKDLPVRTIEKVARLYDVSPVTYPAYPDTSVAVRSLEAAQGKKQEEFVIDVVSISGRKYTVKNEEEIASLIEALHKRTSPSTSDGATDQSPSTADEARQAKDDFINRIKKFTEV